MLLLNAIKTAMSHQINPHEVYAHRRAHTGAVTVTYVQGLIQSP